jgi:uncharacterized membrane-anchored protein YitT (DUF2179 family)
MTQDFNHKPESKKELFLEYLQIAFGLGLTSIGLKAFLLPNGFLDGGITGIAILISTISGWDLSILLIIFSIPLLILAYFTLGRRVVYKSIISIALLAVLIHLEGYQTLTEDKLLIAIFGGLFVGSGIGISIRNGAVLDASEILGIYLNKRFGLAIGKIIMIFNTLLFIITSLLVSVETAMYSILTFAVTANVIDFFIRGFEDFIGFMVVSKKPDVLKTTLFNEMGIGLTVYKGSSGLGSTGIQEDVSIIHTAINRIDIAKFYRTVNKIDPGAFIMEFDVNNVKGGAVRRYVEKV